MVAARILFPHIKLATTRWWRTTTLPEEFGVAGMDENDLYAAMDSAETVRSYKALAEVERAFRSLKTIDLHVRPIHHRLETRVKAHIFLCMPAYYVEWHMREAWRQLLFADEDRKRKLRRDPVAAAQRSEIALNKVATHTLDDGSPAHSFPTLLHELSTIVRNTCQPVDGPTQLTFQMTTVPNPTRQRALQLLNSISL